MVRMHELLCSLRPLYNLPTPTCEGGASWPRPHPLDPISQYVECGIEFLTQCWDNFKSQ